MARRALGCLLCVCVWAGCKGKNDGAAQGSGAGAMDAQCADLAKSCGDTPKHIDQLTGECKQAATKKATCTDKVQALIGCYERDVCGTGDKVWALADLKVLAERHQKCAAERAAVDGCGK